MHDEPVTINIHDLSAREATGRKLNFTTAEFSSDKDDRLIKLALTRATKQERYSPRHRHNFDQVRYVVAGELEYGPLKCHAGDCVYFPEGVFYGPTQLTSDKAENYTIQFEGPSWAHLLTEHEANTAKADLEHEGVLDKAKGIFHWSNGKKQDSYEAMWEKVIGKKLVYPPPRFHSPVLIRSENFPWMPSNKSHGLYFKHLADFNECGPTLRLIKLGSGGKLPVSKTNSHRIHILLSGITNFQGKRLTEGAILYVPPLCACSEIIGESEAVVLAVGLQSKQSAAQELGTDQPI